MLSISSASAETGMASWYSDLSVTASGRSYSASDNVAAHRTLPFGTRVRVHNLHNGKTSVVRIVDRGPFISGRVIDVSTGVARELGFYGQGVTRVRLSVIGKNDDDGDDKPAKRSFKRKSAQNDDNDD
jgi:rare lipoprotein A